MSKIGQNIMTIRKQMGLTQEELAVMMGYKSKSTINKIELGINDIPQRQVVKFAQVLKTTPEKLMGWEDERNDDTSERELIRLFRRVPSDKQSLILNIIRAAVQEASKNETGNYAKS